MKNSSNKSFGILFFIVFLTIGCEPAKNLVSELKKIAIMS